MPAPTTNDEFVELARKSGVLDEKRLDAYLEKLRASETIPTDPAKLAALMVRDSILTHFQAENFLQGRWRRFTIGKYKVLERIGTGGMGSVYLCEHKFMRRRAAVKVLPAAKANDPASLERFYREARAVAALDHPNIVRAYDIDQEDNLHFLVMEYVDGSSLQDLIKRIGPLDPSRAAHYISQAALGLQHAHEAAGLVHRDIKPGNLIVDRNGTVKLLDMGLARFFNDEEDLLTRKYDENVLGTADYLAPEQVLDSHEVDIRADIYSLGATLYYCLTGKTPFGEGTVAQKLIWHQTRQIKPIRSFRNDVPEGITGILDKMMAKDPNQRYQTPIQVAEALAPWTQTSIAPPESSEIPQFAGLKPIDENSGISRPTTPSSHPPSSRIIKDWPSGGTLSPASAIDSGSKKTLPGSPAITPRPSTPQPSPRQAKRATATMDDEDQSPGQGYQLAAAKRAPAVDDESLSWDRSTSDTKETRSRADTDPRAPKKKPARKPAPVERPRASHKSQNKVWILAGAGLGAVLILVGGIFWLLASRNGGGSLGGIGDLVTSATDNRLIVDRTSIGAFPTVREAVKNAPPGCRIIVRGSVHEEQLDLVAPGPGKRLRDITIEPEEGRSVTWTLPQKMEPKPYLISFGASEGVRLRGFTFDGAKKVESIFQMTGICPGLTIENVTLTNFTDYGVLVLNCAGSSDRPVTFSGMEIKTTTPVHYAMYFGVFGRISRPPFNQHIIVRGCRFIGPYEQPVYLSHPNFLKDSRFENNLIQPRPEGGPGTPLLPPI